MFQIFGALKDFLGVKFSIEPKPKKGLMELRNVGMILAKTKEAQYLLGLFEGGERKDVNLDYPITERQKHRSKYSIIYLKKALEIFRHTHEGAVDINLKNDYPITLEDKHFKIIIAPRMDVN